MVQLQVGKRMNLGLFARSILDMRLLGMMPQLAALRDRGGYHWVIPLVIVNKGHSCFF
jgi:hypothetical protein